MGISKRIFPLQEFPEVGLALGPLMEEYGVQAYFCGHEHNLQYLHAQGEPTHYIVSGGGSQVGNYGNSTGQDLLLFHPGSGDDLMQHHDCPVLLAFDRSILIGMSGSRPKTQIQTGLATAHMAMTYCVLHVQALCSACSRPSACVWTSCPSSRRSPS